MADYNMGKKWKPNTLIVNALLDAGADVNHRDDWDKTAMDYSKSRRVFRDCWHFTGGGGEVV